MSASATEAAPGWIPAPGTVIAGRYRLEGLLGQGGMGAVVAGQHIALEDRVAVKFLDPKLANDIESIERFVREAKAAARIKSDHVVRVLDVGATEQGLHFIVMDRLEGCDLEALGRQGPLPIQLAVDCVLQAAEALAEAHAVGIVHRDIKPANLWLSSMRDGSPHVRILDFGISKLAPTHNTGSITDTQSVFGSPTYMSPEQIRSAKHVDARTDVWALGIVLYELIANALPFFADNVAGVIAAISSDTPRPLSELRPDVPIEIEQIVLACLEKNPSRRASLNDLATALAPFASPAGRASVEPVLRVSQPATNVLPPRPSSTAATAISAPTVALVTTQNAFETRPPKRPVRWKIAGLTMGLVLLASAAFFVTSNLSHRGSSSFARPGPRESAPIATSGRAAEPSAEITPPPAVLPSATTVLAPSPPPSTTSIAIPIPKAPRVARPSTSTAGKATTPAAPPSLPAPPPTSDMPLSEGRK